MNKSALLLPLVLLALGCPEDKPSGGAAGKGAAGSGSGTPKLLHCMEDDDCNRVETRTGTGEGVCTAKQKVASCGISHYGSCEVEQLAFGPMTNSQGSELVKLPLIVDRTTTTFFNSENFETIKRPYSARDSCLNKSSNHPLSEVEYVGVQAKWTWADGYDDAYPEYVRPDAAGDHERGQFSKDADESGKPFSRSCYEYNEGGEDRCVSLYGLYPWEKALWTEQCNDPVQVGLDHSCPINNHLIGSCTETVQWRVQVRHYYVKGAIAPQILAKVVSSFKDACAIIKGEWHDSETFAH